MTTYKPIKSPSAPDRDEALSPAKQAEEDVVLAALAACRALHPVKAAAVVLTGLLAAVLSTPELGRCPE